MLMVLPFFELAALTLRSVRPDVLISFTDFLFARVLSLSADDVKGDLVRYYHHANWHVTPSTPLKVNRVHDRYYA
jgi:hypothetical protein